MTRDLLRRISWLAYGSEGSGGSFRQRTCIGEYQPRKFDENRKSVPAGDPIIDYYPTVISEDIFYKAQSQLEQRRTTFIGSAKTRKTAGGSTADSQTIAL